MFKGRIMKTLSELRDSDILKKEIIKELDELEKRVKDIEPESDEAYELSLLAFKKINQMLSL